MINLLKAYINQVRPYPNKITYQLMFSHDPTNVQIFSYDYHTFQIDTTTAGIVPNSLVYGQDNIIIPTDIPEYINDCLDHLISQNLINKYEYNKIIIDNPYIRISDIITDIEWKLHYLCYPKYVIVYKYVNGIITSQATYPLTIDIQHTNDGLSGRGIINVKAYIHPDDVLAYSRLY